MRSNLALLLAERQRATGKRESIRSIARVTGLNEYTVRGFANDTLSEYPKKAIAALCNHLECSIADLLVLENAPDAPQK